MKHALHFTVGLGDHGKHLRILAANERTRNWALSMQARISLVVRAIHNEVEGNAVLDDGARFLHSGIPIATVRTRFLELLVARWPRLRFEVTAPATTTGQCEPPMPVDMPTETRHGMLGMMARGRGVETS